MQRGRKTPTNIVALNVQGTPPRVQPPKDLNVAERKLFVSIVGACDPKHFRESDVAMLISFVQATMLARKLVKGDAVTDWERATRVQASLATRLRLTPAARIDPRTVGKHQISPLRDWEGKV